MAEESAKSQQGDVFRMPVDIVAAYVSNNTVPSSQVPEVINTIYNSLNSIGGGAEAAPEPAKPAVSVRRAVTPDYIVCLEDRKKLKMLKRHLRAAYDMSPEEYRAKWGLPADYPMVAPNYAAQRSAFAKKIGLGRKKGLKQPRKRARR